MIMAEKSQNYVLQSCLVFMFFVHTSQLSLSKCPVPVLNQLTEMNIQHLCKTSGPFPLECLPEIVDLGFPWKLFNVSNRVRLIIIKKMLHLLFSFFINNKPYTSNSTCIRNVLIRLHQQTDQLKKCFNSKKMQKELVDSKHEVYPLILQVQSYFQRIDNFLQDKQYSTCAWKVIHVEIINRFLFMNQLLEMQNKEGESSPSSTAFNI